MELAHAARRPSPIDALPPREQLLVRAACGALIVLSAMALHVAIVAVASARWRTLARWLVMSLLLVHLVYAISGSVKRVAFWPGCAVGLALWLYLVHRGDARVLPRRLAVAIAGTMIGAGLALVAWTLDSPAKHRPHVLLLGIDGLSASHLSAFGYARPTTPFLASLRSEALFLERAFTTSCATLGATVSVLTGKVSLRTHVVYPPQRLDEQSAFQHLPGLLRGAGYETHELVKLHYSDGDSAGLRAAFDSINGRYDAPGTLRWYARGRIGLVLGELRARLAARRGTPASATRIAEAYDLSDDDKLDQAYAILRAADRPTFVHVHLMATHGPFFPVDDPVFAAGATQDVGWMTDFYDDAIRETDTKIEKLFARLRDHALLEDTLVILYSDHGTKWRTVDPIPLVVRLPAAIEPRTRSASSTDNAQLVDIAPTVVDALGLERPRWMLDGLSLLRPLPHDRVIVAVAAVDNRMDPDGLWRLTAPESPLLGLRAVSALDGARWAEFGSDGDAVKLGTIEGPAPARPPFELGEITARVAGLLAGMGHHAFARAVRYARRGE